LSSPKINAGKGTTKDLKREVERLEREYEKFKEDCEVSEENKERYRELIDRLKTYIENRGNSDLRDCPVSLLFNGWYLKTSDGHEWPAVSGEPNANGDFIYSKERQRQEGGPINEGKYWIDPCELSSWLTSWRHIHPEKREAWGTHSITIHPFHTTHNFGRGGFFIHGGKYIGSAGCIDLTNHMEKFAEWMAFLQLCKKRCKIILTVDYTGWDQ
jgi:hypothetical protein